MFAEPRTLGTVVVGTTVPAYVMRDPDLWGSWLRNAEAMVEAHPDTRFFVAIETDARGIEPFTPLLDRLHGLGGEHWTFSLDDGAEVITTGNRLRRITTGQNLVTDYAQSCHASHLLFMAADCCPPGDAIPLLAELNHPLVGGHVPTYCLDGPIVSRFIPEYGKLIRQHMATAAFVLLHSSVFTKIRWRWESSGMSDDPCLHHDAFHLLGIPTFVHHGVVGQHYPEQIPPIEHRHTDAQRTLAR